MAHWIGENRSQNCIWCVKNGDYAPSDFIHTLYTCSTAQAVLQHIRKNLTNLKEITPVSVILTNNRCTKQVDNKGITHKKITKPHSICSVYEDSFNRNTTLDYIFTLTLKYIWDCYFCGRDAIPKEALIQVLGEIRAFINTRPHHIISIYLKENLQVLKIPIS